MLLMEWGLVTPPLSTSPQHPHPATPVQSNPPPETIQLKRIRTEGEIPSEDRIRKGTLEAIS